MRFFQNFLAFVKEVNIFAGRKAKKKGSLCEKYHYCYYSFS